MSERKETIERKMQRAEEKRQMQIKQIVRKAHEEEAKVMKHPEIGHTESLISSVVCAELSPIVLNAIRKLNLWLMPAS